MKIYILFEFKNNASGGGNQFLKALRDYFISLDCYTSKPDEADIILFNSHHLISKLIIIKKLFPEKLFIHRIDGPIRLYNSSCDMRDFIVNTTNRAIADVTIFQSSWSKEQNLKIGLWPNKFEIDIMNSPNPNIFNTKERVGFSKDRKIRLIATSWSANMKKGFGVYKWLDENLDFSKYEMKFVGNTPIAFKNIMHVPPLKSEELAVELKNSDIFITASQKDPCSNSLIEALHCGLPAIVLKDGGHPELVGDGGEVFERQEEIPNLIDKIVLNYKTYQEKISIPKMEDTGRRYYDFFELIFNEQKAGDYDSKKLLFSDAIKIKFFLWISNILFQNILDFILCKKDTNEFGKKVVEFFKALRY